MGDSKVLLIRMQNFRNSKTVTFHMNYTDSSVNTMSKPHEINNSSLFLYSMFLSLV